MSREVVEQPVCPHSCRLSGFSLLAPNCVQCLGCCYVACPHVPQNRPANLLYSLHSLFVDMGGFFGGWRCWCCPCEFCWRSWMWGVLWSFWLGMAKSRQDFLNISWEREFYPSFTIIITLGGNTSESSFLPNPFSLRTTATLFLAVCPRVVCLCI